MKLIIGLAVMFCLVTSATCQAGSLDDEQRRVERNAPAPDSTRRDPDVISNDYRENEAKADQKYKGKSLILRGVISSVKVLKDDVSVVFFEVKDPQYKAACCFASTHKKKVANLNSGDTVEIAGVCGGSTPDGIVFFQGYRIFAHEKK